MSWTADYLRKERGPPPPSLHIISQIRNLPFPGSMTMIIPLHICLLLLAAVYLANLLPQLQAASISDNSTITATNTGKPGCPTHCGNLTVPYPFGIGPGCALNSTFDIVCDDNSDPPRAFSLSHDAGPLASPLQILNISESQLRVRNQISILCLDDIPPPAMFSGSSSPFAGKSSLFEYPFPLSPLVNKFFVMGCGGGVHGYLIDEGSENDDADPRTNTTECAPSCAEEGDPKGNGCCQTVIPSGLRSFTFRFQYMSVDLRTNPQTCSYAFVGEAEEFHFLGTLDINDPNLFLSRLNFSSVPLVLDWAIGSENCSEARQNRSSYACQQNTDCIDAGGRGGGYRCSCLPGFEGNPYLSPGCTDINECAGSDSSPSGYSGDGMKNGTTCVRSRANIPIAKLILGLSCGLLFLIVGGTLIHKLHKKRQLTISKDKVFKQNGGLFFKRILSSGDGMIMDTAKLFSIEELNSATGNFSEDNIIGEGSQGTVYRGVLANGQVVAIKKVRMSGPDEIEKFINEVVCLSRINHKNVVKLLGCCLETEVPMLVYELISNGTLYDHIHSVGGESWLRWTNILQIAIEVANALAYLHSFASGSIFKHNNVIKSKNILLDESYAAKVSDFGALNFSWDRTDLLTVVQGTQGYLDPEYHSSGQLTEKSDVYSFGVILAELLTREKPYVEKREHQNLATMFSTSMAVSRPFHIPDAPRAQLMAVCDLVLKCISARREDRPTMKEVAEELERLRRPKERKGGRPSSEADTSCLLREYDQGCDLYPVVLANYEGNSCTLSFQWEMKDEMMHPR